MRAMILAAGKGTRMGPLTKAVPKPLLKIRNKYLIEYVIQQLIDANISEIVMNVSYHASLIQSLLQDGSAYGIQITYSYEPEPLETGGGIAAALPLLGKDPFIVISCDIICDYPLKKLKLTKQSQAHLVMVNNPSYHPEGDFGMNQGYASLSVNQKLTYASMGLFSPDLFLNCEVEHFPLSKILFPAIKQSKITAELYEGLWFNVGTPQDLETLNAFEETLMPHPLLATENTIA